MDLPDPVFSSSYFVHAVILQQLACSNSIVEELSKKMTECNPGSDLKIVRLGGKNQSRSIEDSENPQIAPSLPAALLYHFSLGGEQPTGKF